MPNSIIIAAEYPSIASDNTLTFAGVLQKYFIVMDDTGDNVGISRRWNDNTKKAYKSDYENFLLPLMNKLLGERKPIHLLSDEDVDLVLAKLKRKRHLTDSRTAHYYHLIKSVYMAGVEHGLYPNNLMWSDTGVEEIDLNKESDRVRVMTRIRKSFSIDEERRIADWFLKLDPVEADGEEVGLLLMYFMGLRNGEACGADFGNFHELTYHKDIIVFDMLKSTKVGSNQLKAGGKTSNAPRTLTVVAPLADFIRKRRDALEKMIADGQIRLQEGYKDASQLPVVCRSKDYLRRADSYSLSKAGQSLFRRIKIDKSEVHVMETILRSSEFRDSIVDEKEVTTYLFRRNCATHIYNLGFSLSEIQYWMGHEVENPGDSRNAYADPDALARIDAKMQKHPFLTLLCHNMESRQLRIENDDKACFTNEGDAAKMILKGGQDKYWVKIETREPNQKLEIHVDTMDRAASFTADILINSGRTVVKNPAETVSIQKRAYEKAKKGSGKD